MNGESWGMAGTVAISLALSAAWGEYRLRLARRRDDDLKKESKIADAAAAEAALLRHQDWEHREHLQIAETVSARVGEQIQTLRTELSEWLNDGARAERRAWEQHDEVHVALEERLDEQDHRLMKLEGRDPSPLRQTGG